MNCGELCDAINQVTEGYKGIDFNHIGMIIIQNDSILVLEASGSEVKLTPLETFKSPGSNDYFEAWAEYYEKLNIEIPEGKPGCNPGGISTSKKIKILGTL